MLTLTIALACALFAVVAVALSEWWTTPRSCTAGRHTHENRARATGRDLTLATLRMVLRTAQGKNSRMPARSAHAAQVSRRFEARAWEAFGAQA
jgi:hypothetical protein